MINYRELLKKYMKAIGDCEGYYFDVIYEDNPSYLSSEEKTELIILANEVDLEYQKECK